MQIYLECKAHTYTALSQGKGDFKILFYLFFDFKILYTWLVASYQIYSSSLINTLSYIISSFLLESLSMFPFTIPISPK